MQSSMIDLSKEFGQFCVQNSVIIATAESCTAGLIAATIAQTPGSSAWLDCGFIVYTPKAKNTILGVNPETIEKYNITSLEVSNEMALGALERSEANVALAITGVAGPSGGTKQIPVGQVCMSWIFKLNDKGIYARHETVVFEGDRNKIRQNAAEHMIKQCMFYYTK